MKKIILISCFVFSLLISTTLDTYASSYSYKESISVIENNEVSRSVKKITAKKTRDYKNAAGATQFSIVITGTFTYNGKSSSCIDASAKVTNIRTGWKAISVSGSKSANKAIGKAVIANYFNGIEIGRQTASVSLICNSVGNLS